MGRGEGLSSEPPMDPPLHTNDCSIARSDQDYIYVNTRCVCKKTNFLEHINSQYGYIELLLIYCSKIG